MSEHLAVDRIGARRLVARVTLNRPEVHNAFNAGLVAELRDTFERLSSEPPNSLRAVVLAGAGPSFCAGADVSWMRRSLALSVAENEADAAAMAEMFDAIDRFPAPVVARVQRAAIGGGMGLCAVADIVIADARATFAFSEVRLGILPAVISPFVLRKIGESHARALFTTGERFDAERASHIGLVHQLVATESDLDAAVDRTLSELMAAGPTAARAAKAIIRDQRELSAPEVRRLTVGSIARQRTSAEGQEGLTAFLERRPPAWREGEH